MEGMVTHTSMYFLSWIKLTNLSHNVPGVANDSVGVGLSGRHIFHNHSIVLPFANV